MSLREVGHMDIPRNLGRWPGLVVQACNPSTWDVEQCEFKESKKRRKRNFRRGMNTFVLMGLMPVPSM
jgi:hypothetical protein